MSRRRSNFKKKIFPDSKFNSNLLGKFINILMINGKKTVSESIIYKALENINKKIKKDHIEIFKSAIYNVRPIVEVKSRRVGGSTYQIPIEVRPSRQNSLAMKWIVKSAKKRKEKTMTKKLEKELLDAIENKGNAIKIKEEVHKMAEANKAFAHYRW